MLQRTPPGGDGPMSRWVGIVTLLIVLMLVSCTLWLIFTPGRLPPLP